MKKILIICFSNLKNDPRVYRQIRLLRDENKYEISAAGLNNPDLENVEFTLLNSAPKTYIKRAINLFYLKCKKFEKYFWSNFLVKDAYEKLNQKKIDLIIANDLNTLPLALRLAKNNNAKVLLDVHEYFPRHLDDQWWFRVFFQEYWEYICYKYLPNVDSMITVCLGIAEEYSKNYGVKCGVLTNAPFFKPLSPSQSEDRHIRLIHHGGINKSRKIENMIYLMDLLDDRFTLDFMLIENDKKYLKSLKSLAKNNARIKFREPVPMPEISSTINQYDIGLYLLDPVGFNNRMALPNKLFEYIQGRLVVAIWPSFEMARIVKKYECGVVSEDFTIESMAKVLNQLSTDDIRNLKKNSHIAASHLCAETNRQLLLENVQQLIS